MTTVAHAAPPVAVTAEATGVRAAVPWYLWAVTFASTSIMAGVIWDISWHRTIGRDSFWTPAHLAIYLGGIVAGLSCGWLVLRTTWGGPAGDRAAGVSFWGFRGPLGAWVCIWGAIAMITSAPFDDWWHNAYGLDVEILSPPHLVLAAGIFAIQVGGMLMALAGQNNAPGAARGASLLFPYAAGIVILVMATVAMEEIGVPNDQHRARFFLITAAMFPFLLVGISRGARSRWGATGAAAVYVGLTLLAIWILQLVPGEPMLAPILRPLDRMVPPPFPMMLVVPALVIDLLLRRAPARGRRLRQAAVAAAAGVLAMLAFGLVQWPLATFLLTDGARSYVFGADQWGYNVPRVPMLRQFWGEPMTVAAAGWSGLLAAVSAVVGLGLGSWMTRVRR